MCCFSRPVRFVGGTKIFARGLDDGRELLVYAMDVELGEALAMVLPLPVPASCAEDAVRFVDLEGYPTLFDDLEKAFPPDYTTMTQAKGGALRFAPPARTLVVHEVGLFEASFVPTPADFARLDPRFRMPDDVFRHHPTYADHGFAVFRLSPKKRGFFARTTRQRVHPMAFSFPRRDPRALFFPTLHVHDGVVEETARFDHALYCQADGVLDATLDWKTSHGPIGERVDVSRAAGVFDPGRHARRQGMWGALANRDVVLRAPEGVKVAELRGAGERHAYAVRATAAYMHAPHDARQRAWQRTATTKLPALCVGLREGLATWTAARADVFALTTLTDALPPCFMNGPELFTGTSYLDGARATPGGPGRVAFRIFTSDVEPQDVTLAFARLPERAMLDAITRELEALVDRAVA